jgi:hypothetical protein
MLARGQRVVRERYRFREGDEVRGVVTVPRPLSGDLHNYMSSGQMGSEGESVV